MKQILNYDNYFIDENGNVFNSNTNHYLKGSIGENGYKYYRLSKNNHKTMYYAHRLVAETYIDNPNGLPVVNHKDGNKLNNNVNNLEWVTYNENALHWHNTIKKNYRRPIEYYKSDLPGEVWKEYKNYLISSMGRIRHKIKNNLLKPVITCGYYKVRLSNDGLAEDWMVHHLVYLVFFDDYDKTKIIDHIDGNKLNNNINNLRLVTNSENAMASLYETRTNSSAKQVGLYDLNNNLLHIYLSCREAARILNLDSSTISKVCRGQNKTHGGFIFKYIDK